MLQDSSPEALGLGVCAAAFVGAWLYLRGNATPPYRDLFTTPVAVVSRLCVYPVKSCGRLEVDSVECWTRGLKYDRTIVVMDRAGYPVSQRVGPTMALIQPRMDLSKEGTGGVSLFLTAPGMGELEIKIPEDDCPPTNNLKVWEMSGEGHFLGEEIGAWFSRYLDIDGCRVYYMSPRHKPRHLKDDPRWKFFSHREDETSYGDTAPLLVLSEASVEVLNTKLEERLQERLTIERFRPNIILSGCSDHAEDHWSEVCIGGEDGVILRHIKPCTRCKMITVNQETGTFTKGEPMDTLFTYRFYSMIYGIEDERFSVTPVFGSNYGTLQRGKIRVKDVVRIRGESSPKPLSFH